MGVQERAKRKKEVHAFGMLKANEKTIKDQARVIKENWSELQELKRILMDEYEDVWREIQYKIK